LRAFQKIASPDLKIFNELQVPHSRVNARAIDDTAGYPEVVK
jgi:hypothetical protein